MKIYLILGAVLLIKQSLGDTEYTSKRHKLKPGKAFRSAILAKIAALSEEPIKLGKKLLADAYADKSNNEYANRILHNILSELEESDKSLTDFLGLSSIFDFTSERITISYDDERREDLLHLKEALEKHNVKDVANEFQSKFDEFLKWLKKEFEEKRDKFTFVGQRRVKAFRELWLQFKEETNFDKRRSFIVVISDYLDFVRVR